MRVRVPPSAHQDLLYVFIMNSKKQLSELKSKLKIAEEKLAKAGIGMGDAGGSGEWHDNSAWDNAVVDFKVREEIVNSLKDAIRKLNT